MTDSDAGSPNRKPTVLTLPNSTSHRLLTVEVWRTERLFDYGVFSSLQTSKPFDLVPRPADETIR